MNDVIGGPLSGLQQASGAGGMQIQPNPMMNPMSASPMALNNYMGTPMGNGGANMVPYQTMQQSFMPDPKTGALNSFKCGGVVGYAPGGMAGAPPGAPPGPGGPPPGAPMPPQGGLPPPGGGAPGGGQMQALAQKLSELMPDAQLAIVDPPLLEILAQLGPVAAVKEVVGQSGDQQLMVAVEALTKAAGGEPVYLNEEQFTSLAKNVAPPQPDEATGLPKFGAPGGGAGPGGPPPGPPGAGGPPPGAPGPMNMQGG